MTAASGKLTERNIRKSLLLGAAYGMCPADSMTGMFLDASKRLRRELADRQSLGRIYRARCPHISVCPKEAYRIPDAREAVNNTIQETARLYCPTLQRNPGKTEPPMLGDWEWRNIPDRPRGFFRESIRENIAAMLDGVPPYDAKQLANYAMKDAELGYVIRHVGCETGRHSTRANNIMEIARRKNTMNKNERNQAVRELDSTESDINKIEKQTSKLIAADQKKLDAIQAKLDKRRAQLIKERDLLTRPLYRRVQYLRHELAASF